MLTIVKKNDSYDAITYQLENEDNSTVDLTGASVNFVMGKKNKLITNAKATVTSATSGIVSYQLTPSDTLVSGTFLAEFVVTFANGTTKTYPSNGYITVDVEQNLDTSQNNVVLDMIAAKQGDFEAKLNSILLQKGDINLSTMSEYTWTATEGQLLFTFPTTSNYSTSSKWFQVYVGGIPVDDSLVNRSYSNQFALTTDSANIKDGMRVHATWVEPLAPLVPSSYKIIPQQDTPPTDAVEGELWFDTSDNTYQGTVFDDLNTRVTNNTSSLAEKVSQTELSINPDSYTGTDLQKVQSAFNDAYTNKRAIRLSRLYDITGGTIQINKAPDPDRTPIYIIGENGGGFKKTDTGFWFDSPNGKGLTGDLYFSNLLFQGINNSGSTVFNGYKLIRIFSSNNAYRNCDGIISSTDYVQSLRFQHDSMISGHGTLFNSPDYFDTVIENCLIENTQNFFSTTGPNGCFGVRIINNCIEGLTGTAISIVNVNSMVISNNYFESNAGGHIKFSSTGYAGETLIMGNWHGASIETGVTALIVWPINPAKSVSIGNYAQNSMAIHDFSAMTNLGNGGRILSIDNDPNTFGNQGIYNIAYAKKTTDATTSAVTTAWGYVNKIYNSKSVTITNGTSQTVSVPMPVSVNADDFISVTIGSNAKINVRNYYGNGLNVNINVENNDTTSQTITINVVVIRVMS